MNPLNPKQCLENVSYVWISVPSTELRPNSYQRSYMCFGSTRMHQKWFWKSMSLYWIEKLKIHFYFWLKIGSNDFYNICVKDKPWYNLKCYIQPIPQKCALWKRSFYKHLAQASRTTSGQQKYCYGSWQEVPDHTLSSSWLHWLWQGTKSRPTSKQYFHGFTPTLIFN